MSKRKSKTLESQSTLSWEEWFRQGGDWILIIFSLPLFILPLWGIFVRDADYMRGLFTKPGDWTKTTGQITHSELQYHARGPKTGDTIEAITSYKYWIDGKQYEGYLVSFEKPISSKWTPHDAERIAAEYPVGKNIVVFYLPTEPTFSVLEPTRKDYSQLIIPACGSLVGLAGLLCGIWGNRRFRRSR